MTKSATNEYWFKHYTAFQNFKGTKSSYAKLHDLKLKSFYSWCKKFEATPTKAIDVSVANPSGDLKSVSVPKILLKEQTSEKGFAELSISKQSHLNVPKLKILFSGITLELSELPNCDWLAELSRKVV
jgi:hypothetical protein